MSGLEVLYWGVAIGLGLHAVWWALEQWVQRDKHCKRGNSSARPAHPVQMQRVSGRTEGNCNEQ